MKINNVEYEIEGIACPKCGILCIPTEAPKLGWIYDKCWNCGSPLPPIKVREIHREKTRKTYRCGLCQERHEFDSEIGKKHLPYIDGDW